MPPQAPPKLTKKQLLKLWLHPSLKHFVGWNLVICGVVASLLTVVGVIVKPPGSAVQLQPQTTKVSTADGKEITTTIDPTTGQATVVTVDTKTGQTSTVTEPISNVPSNTLPGNGGSTGGGTTGGSGGTTGGGTKPTVTLTATPASVTSGSAATLNWSASNASACTAGGAWSGSKSSAGGSQSTGALTSSQTYSLTCTNTAGSTSASASVTVTAAGGGGGGTTPPAPAVSISVNPSVITSGGSATLSWNGTNNPTSCTASTGWSGTKVASGTQSVNPTSTTTYKLTCTNAGGSGSGQTTLTVNTPAPVCGQSGGTCTAAQVAAHNSASNCWVIYSNSYYNVTSYVNKHPSGSAVFNSSTCGQNISGYMDGSQSTAGQRHAHSGGAYSTLESYKIGPVSG
jgi:hypothetical protein